VGKVSVYGPGGPVVAARMHRSPEDSSVAGSKLGPPCGAKKMKRFDRDPPRSPP
jgi:hypothetical protein